MTEYKLRQLRANFDEDKLRQIGAEMKTSGQMGLKIEKGKLGVSSLKFLECFDHLEAIAIYGVTRDIATLAELTNLRSVALCSLTTKDVSFLVSLPKLEEVWVQGVNLKDWESMRQLKQVKALTLFKVRHHDLSFLEDMEGLQFLKLDNCSQVATLPSMANLQNLRRVILDTTKSINDICGIADSPNLKDLIVGNAAGLSPESFNCLMTHPTIQKILPGIGLTNSQKYREVVDLLPPHLLMESFYGTEHEYFEIK